MSGAAFSSAASLELKADGAGHFYATPSINGVPISMVVDTGATVIALSYEDAQRAFLPVRDADFTRLVDTASGPLRVASVRIPTLTLGPIYMTQVDALVLPRQAGQTNLLGMNFLKRLSGFEVKSDRLIMRP
jgi:aspartyl protease family protein